MADRFLHQPLRFIGGPAGQVALTADADRHLRDKILAALFTSPGERVNMPAFGVGLRRALFEGVDDLMLAALRFQIVQGLRRDVGDEIAIDDVRLDAPAEGEVVVSIDYRRAGERAIRGIEVRL